MSTVPPNFTPTTTTPTTPTSPATIIGGYVVPVIVIIGIFVLIAMNKLNAETGIAVISVIAGVHGGAAVTNAAAKP